MFIAWAVARWYRVVPETKRSAGAGVMLRLTTFLLWLLTVLLSLVVSPALAIRQDVLGSLTALATSVVTGDQRLGIVIGLVLLTTYLWWRGLLLGRLIVTRERIYTRFVGSLSVLVFLLIVASQLAGAARAQISALLAVILAIDVFVGLVGIALAYLRDTARDYRQHQGAAPLQQIDRPTANGAWLVTTFGISGIIVGAAFLLALLISYDALRSFARMLQPLADALGGAITWLINALAFLLFLIFNGPIAWLKSLVGSTSRTSGSTSAPGQPGTTYPGLNQGDLGWYSVARVILVLLAVLALVWLIQWVLKRFNSLLQTAEFEETRESLDAVALLRAQLRGALGGGRGRAASLTSQEVALASGSVRYLYREVLRAAARRRIGREPNETPDEFAKRLAALADGAATPRQIAAISTLTGAYDSARYGEAEAAGGSAPEAVVEAEREVATWLDTRPTPGGATTRSSGRQRRGARR
jgi:hypothetical protein